MKAIQINQYGGNEVFEMNENAPTPKLKEGQILVDVYAASINPFDLIVRAGYMEKMIPLQFPTTLGGDFSGVVTALGNGAYGFTIGDEVFGQALLFNGGSGSFAEMLATNTKNTALKPNKTSFEEAAALPLDAPSLAA